MDSGACRTRAPTAHGQKPGVQQELGDRFAIYTIIAHECVEHANRGESLRKRRLSSATITPRGLQAWRYRGPLPLTCEQALQRPPDGSPQPRRRKQRAVVVPATQRCWVVPGKAVLVDGSTTEPAPDAADDQGLVALLDDQDSAGSSAAPAHLAELVDVRVVKERWCGVRH